MFKIKIRINNILRIKVYCIRYNIISFNFHIFNCIRESSFRNIKLTYICIGAGLGSWIGDTLSFYLGLVFGPKLKSFSFIKKRESAIKRGEQFFDKYGWSGILIGRLIPAIRPFIPFIAGLSSMKSYVFIISSIFACVIWSIALAIIIIGMDNIINLF